MPDWFAPLTICVLVLLFLVISEWLERRKTSSAAASGSPKPREPKPDQPKPDRSSDSIEIVTVSVGPSSPSGGAKPVERAPAPARSTAKSSVKAELPRLDEPEDDAVDPTRVGKVAAAIQPPTNRIVYDED